MTTAGSAEIARDAMRRQAIIRILHAVVEVDDRCEVEIDAERREVAALPRRVLPHREQPLGRVAMQRDDLGDRRHAGQRRRKPRDRAAFLVGRDPQRREALPAAELLQRIDLLADRVRRDLPCDIARAEEDARDGAALDQRLQVAGLR